MFSLAKRVVSSGVRAPTLSLSSAIRSHSTTRQNYRRHHHRNNYHHRHYHIQPPLKIRSMLYSTPQHSNLFYLNTRPPVSQQCTFTFHPKSLNHFSLPVLSSFTLFPSTEQRVSPFDDPEEETPDLSKPKTSPNLHAKYDENHVRFDFSQPQRRYRLLPDGTEVLLEGDEPDGILSALENEFIHDVIPQLTKAIVPIVEKIETVLDGIAEDGSGNSTSSKIPSTFPLSDDNTNTNTNQDNTSQDHDGQGGTPRDPSQLTLAKIPFNLRQRYTALRASFLTRVKLTVKEWYEFVFPSDFIGVVDVTVTQMVRIFDVTTALIKGYLIGAVAALCLRVPLLTYTKACIHYGFYPYLTFYIWATGYMMANLIHIGAVVISEFPIVKDLILFAMELQKLAAAPPYVLARAVVKFSRELLKVKEQKRKADEEKEKELLEKKEKRRREREEQHQQQQQQQQQHQYEHVNSDSESNGLVQHDIDVFPSYNSDGDIDTIVTNITSTTTSFLDEHCPSSQSSEYIAEASDFIHDAEDSFSSLIDDMQSAMDNLKSPNTILAEIHSTLEGINHNSDVILSQTHYADPSSTSFFSAIAEVVGPENDNGTHIDIIVDDLLTIKQDVKTDTTLLEVSTPDSMKVGSNFTIITPKSKVVVHV